MPQQTITVERSGMDTCRLIQVIETTILRRGDGTACNPVRIVTQYWTTDGALLAEVDPFAERAK